MQEIFLSGINTSLHRTPELTPVDAMNGMNFVRIMTNGVGKNAELTEVRSYALLITHTTACTKPSKRSNIELGIQLTIRVATRLLPLRYGTFQTPLVY